jgi:hypothetical protein
MGKQQIFYNTHWGNWYVSPSKAKLKNRNIKTTQLHL